MCVASHLHQDCQIRSKPFHSLIWCNDFRLQEAFEEFCSRVPVAVPRKVQQEFRKRQRQCEQNQGKAKLDLSNSKLTDQHVRHNDKL